MKINQYFIAIIILYTLTLSFLHASLNYPCQLCRTYVSFYTQFYSHNLNNGEVLHQHGGSPQQHVELQKQYLPSSYSLCSSPSFRAVEWQHIYMSLQDAWELQQLDQHKTNQHERSNTAKQTTAFIELAESHSRSDYLFPSSTLPTSSLLSGSSSSSLSGKYNLTRLLELATQPAPRPIPQQHIQHYVSMSRSTCLLYQHGMCVLDDGAPVAPAPSPPAPAPAAAAPPTAAKLLIANPFTKAYIRDKNKMLQQDQLNKEKKRKYYAHQIDEAETKRLEAQYLAEDMKEYKKKRPTTDRLPKFKKLEWCLRVVDSLSANADLLKLMSRGCTYRNMTSVIKAQPGAPQPDWERMSNDEILRVQAASATSANLTKATFVKRCPIYAACTLLKQANYEPYCSLKQVSTRSISEFLVGVRIGAARNVQTEPPYESPLDQQHPQSNQQQHTQTQQQNNQQASNKQSSSPPSGPSSGGGSGGGGGGGGDGGGGGGGGGGAPSASNPNNSEFEEKMAAAAAVFQAGFAADKAKAG